MTASPTDDLASAERRIQELTKELSEAREQHAATAEILRIISSSPTELQRVFSEIAASAARLCDAVDATIYEVDGGDLQAVMGLFPKAVGSNWCAGLSTDVPSSTGEPYTLRICRPKPMSTQRAAITRDALATAPTWLFQ